MPGLSRAGDGLIAIATSERSGNILRAIEATRQNGLITVGFTGNSGDEMVARRDLCLRASSGSTPLLQQIHITAGHIVCQLVEARLFPRSNQPYGSRDLAE